LVVGIPTHMVLNIIYDNIILYTSIRNTCFIKVKVNTGRPS